MTSPLLALFVRSLREEARAKSTYWARAALALFILAMVAWTIMSQKYLPVFGPSAQGLPIFAGVAWLQGMAVTLMGAFWFSSAITEEKEDDTLGLLRMTNLDALSILLGKSTSRLFNALLLLVSPFPFMVMTITLGGVSMAQVQAVYGALLAYTFLVGNVALLWSVLARTTARAMLGTGAILLVFLGGGELLTVSFLRSAPLQMVRELTPQARLREIVTTGFAGSPVGFHEAAYLFLGVLCFCVAWKIFPRLADRAQEGRSETLAAEKIPWEDEVVVPARVPARPAPRASADAERRRIRGLRRRWLLSRPQKHALAWKDFYFHAGGMLGWSLRATIYGSALLLFLANDDPPWRGVNENFMEFVPLALGLELALAASRIFRWELNDQTWSSLALLPLTTWQITWRKVSGHLLALSPSLVAFAVVVASLVKEFFQRLTAPIPMSAEKAAAFGAMLALFFSSVLTLYLIAYFSLAMRRGALPLGLVVGFVVAVVLGIAALMMVPPVSGARGNTGQIAQLMILALNGVFLLGCAWMHRVVLRKAARVAGE